MREHPTMIPAALFGDALLSEYFGRIEDEMLGEGLILRRVLGRCEFMVRNQRYPRVVVNLRLPLTRPEARNRLCVILAAGKLCGCPRDAKWASPACPHCRGSEWVRKPAPAWHLLPVAEGGSLLDEHAKHSPVLLACHATRVAAGMGGIVDVLPSWRWISKYGRHWLRGDTLDVRERDVLSEGWHAGWRCRRERCAAGPETGEAGKFAADAAALVAGYALLDDDVLRLPPSPPITVKENDDG